jgi:hypothetical protein
MGTPATRQIVIGSGGSVANTHDAFWYSDISGYNGTLAYALPVTQASIETDFVGFDFVGVWDMITGTAMPYLRGLTIDDKVYF